MGMAHATFLHAQYDIKSKILNREVGYYQDPKPIMESKNFNGTEKAILIQLLKHLGPLGIIPAVPTIAQATGRSVRTIQNNLKSLRESGWIGCERRFRASNSYELKPKLLSLLGCNKTARQVGNPIPQDLHHPVQVLRGILDLIDLKSDLSSSSIAKAWASPGLPEERDQNENPQIQAKENEMHDEDEDLREIEETNPLSKAYQCRRVTRKPKPNAKPWQSKKVQRREEPAHQIIRKFEDATRNLNLASHTVSKQTILDILAMLKVLGFEKTCEWIDYAVAHWDEMYLAEKKSNANYKLIYYPNLVNLTAHWRYNTWLEGGYEPKEEKPKPKPLSKAKQDAPKVSVSQAKFFNPLKK